MIPHGTGLQLRDITTVTIAATGASGTVVAGKTGQRLVVLSMTLAAIAAAGVQTSIGSSVVGDTAFFQGVSANKLYQLQGILIGASGDGMTYAVATPSGTSYIVVTYAFIPV